tara:strand:- start:915 stop:1373 length:459 start_codon:yes stop_codon:yes gene_type:complete
MNKILNYIFLFSLFALLGCAYEPVLSKKNYQFSINIKEQSGDEQINSIIIDNFYFQKEHKTEYDLTITSKKEKNIISKDSKGDPAIFELVINVKYSVKKDNKILIENELNEKNTYNNIADKFELKNYENNIINNLSSRMSGIIMSSIRNKNQ